MSRKLLALLFLAASLPAQKYNGPRPSKPDIPYLLHADSLVATEVSTAKEQSKKDEITYVVAGASSPVKTPLASPIFLMQAEKIAPERMQLYKLEAKNGQREVLFTRKKKQTAKPIRLSFTKLTSDNLYRFEVDESLENGEYSLTVDQDPSNQVFCFQVY